MRNNDIVLEGVRLIFKNFSGAKGQYNPQGKRNFHVILPPDIAEQLGNAGWNVKRFEPRMEGDDPMFTLPVAVSYRLYPPKIVLVSSNGKTILDEDELNILDFTQFTNIDVIINPSHYNFNGQQGIKAYLRSMYATIYEDELEKKYMAVPDSAINSLVPNEM